MSVPTPPNDRTPTPAPTEPEATTETEATTERASHVAPLAALGLPHPRRRRRKYVTALFAGLFALGLAGFVYLGMWQGDGAQTQRHSAKQLEREIAYAVRMLGQSEHETREQAAQQLVALGEPAVPALLAALAHDNGHVREAAVHVLRAIGKPAVEPLRVEVETNPATRARALRTLCGLGQPAAHTLATWLDTSEPRKHDEAPRTGAVLNALLRHGTTAPVGREPVISSRSELEAMTPAVLVTTLLRLWDLASDSRVEANAEARANAATAERVLANLSVATLMFAAAENDAVAAAVQRYMQTVRGPSAIPSLVALMRLEEPPALHAHVTQLLAEFGDAAVPALADVLHSTVAPPRMRRSAAKLLARHPPVPEQPAVHAKRTTALAHALTDTAAEVRAAAVTALKRWAPNSAAAMQALAAATWHWSPGEVGFAEAHAALKSALSPEAEMLAEGNPTPGFAAALAGFVRGWETTAVARPQEEAARLDALVATLRNVTVATAPTTDDATPRSVACARLLAATDATELVAALPAGDEAFARHTFSDAWKPARVAAMRLLEHLVAQSAGEQPAAPHAAVPPAAVDAVACALQTATAPPRNLRERLLQLLANLGPAAAEALPAVDALRLSPESTLREQAEATWRAILASDNDSISNNAEHEALRHAPAALWLNRLDPGADAYAADAEMRAHAAWHLKELDAEALQLMQREETQHARLLAALADENKRVRRRIRVVFVRLGEAALPSLLNALTESADAPPAVEGTLLALHEAGTDVRTPASEALLNAHASGSGEVAPRLYGVLRFLGLAPQVTAHLLQEAATAKAPSDAAGDVYRMAASQAKTAAHEYWQSQPTTQAHDGDNGQHTGPEAAPRWVADLVAALGAVIASETAEPALRRQALDALAAWRRHAAAALEGLLTVAVADLSNVPEEDLEAQETSELRREANELLRRWLRPGNRHRPPGLVEALLRKLAAAQQADRSEAQQRVHTLLDATSEVKLATAMLDALPDEALQEAALGWLAARPKYAEWVHDRFRRTAAALEGALGADASAVKRKLVAYAAALAHLGYDEALPDLRRACQALEGTPSEAAQNVRASLDEVISALERR